MRLIKGPLLALALVSCGPIAHEMRSPATREVVGQILYESRHATTQGASAELTLRPARFVDVELLRGDEVVATGQTDEAGAFAVPFSGEGLIQVRVSARVRVRGHDAAIARDAGGQRTHMMRVPATGAPMTITARDVDGDAGAFHVVDTMLRGLDAVQEWTGQTLPPVFAYWVRGGTREWSFYRGERPAGSGRYALELLGGDPGQQSTSDTDEHDEAIILHELGHFVMDRLSSDSSTGGMHPRGAHIDPGLAWEEGRASWFALAVLGAPFYRDTVGVQPWGSTRVDEDLESGPDPVAGFSSETSVTKVLWDLTDQGEVDTDHDGIALGPARVLTAMMAHASEEGAFPSLPSFLRYLLTAEVVSRDELTNMLTRTGEPVEELVPEAAELPWPLTIAVGEGRSGKIDGLTQPAPSGGPNLPVTGFDANHTYRVHVTEPGMLVVRLTIEGSGRSGDHSDLNLELLDLNADRLADARTQEPTEALAHLVSPGYYIIKVRDGGQGNRADYRVRVSQETLGDP